MKNASKSTEVFEQHRTQSCKQTQNSTNDEKRILKVCEHNEEES
jgi:hypothetical protein